MPLILTIRYTKFLIKNEANALAALKALNGAITVESKHIHVGKKYEEVYWPAPEQKKISIETVNDSQLKRCDPDDIKPAKVTLQLTAGGES